MVTSLPRRLTWASPGVRRRARARGIDVQFTWDLRPSAPEEEWRYDIDQTAIPGGIFGEIVFFHKRSKTLILTDTILNLELDKLTQPWRFATRMTGTHGVKFFFGMRLPMLLQRRKARAAVHTILAWQPERITLAHGRCLESNGSEMLRRVFAWAL